MNTVERLFGGNHPHVATAYENLAASLRRSGRSQEAINAETRALQIRNALLITPARPSRRIGDPGAGAEEPVKRDPGQAWVGGTVLDVSGAARYLKVSSDTIYGLVRSGEMAHTRVGKSIRFRVADLDRFLEERTSRRWERLDRRGRPPRR